MAFGVGHPEQALPDMRGARARSAQIGGPDFITHSFQVSAYSGEPFTSSAACNLFANDRCRPALGDELSEIGPQMALIGFAFSGSGAGPRLAGQAGSPNWNSLWTAGELERKRPASDAAEEMVLGESIKLGAFDFLDVGITNFSFRDQGFQLKFLQPRANLRIIVIVEIHMRLTETLSGQKFIDRVRELEKQNQVETIEMGERNGEWIITYHTVQPKEQPELFE